MIVGCVRVCIRRFRSKKKCRSKPSPRTANRRPVEGEFTNYPAFQLPYLVGYFIVVALVLLAVVVVLIGRLPFLTPFESEYCDIIGHWVIHILSFVPYAIVTTTWDFGNPLIDETNHPFARKKRIGLSHVK